MATHITEHKMINQASFCTRSSPCNCTSDLIVTRIITNRADQVDFQVHKISIQKKKYTITEKKEE